MAIAAQLPIITSRQSRMFLEITTLLLFLNASNVWFWAADIQFSGDSTKTGWFVIQYLSLFVFGTCAILFVVERHRLLIPDLVLFAIGALLIVSTFANSNEYLEISAPVRTVLFIMAAIFVRNSNPEFFLARTGFYMALFLFLSVAASLAGYGLMSGIHDGLWRGAFEHKNRFGHFAGLSVFFVVYLLNTKRIGHGVAALLLALAALSLIMSDSATAIVAVAISLVTVKLLDTFRIRGMSGFARTYLAIGSIGLIGFAGSFLSDWAATTLGRSSDLTGRTQVWEFFVNYANEKPFVGWGVFSETYRDIILVHARESLWGSIGTAHSAYIQILLEGGYIVLCMFIFYLVYILFTCTYKYLSVKDNNLKLLLSSAIFLMVTMFSESINGFTLGFGLMLFTIAHHDFRPMQTVWQART